MLGRVRALARMSMSSVTLGAELIGELGELLPQTP
jgi:hypothetical protein